MKAVIVLILFVCVAHAGVLDTLSNLHWQMKIVETNNEIAKLAKEVAKVEKQQGEFGAIWDKIWDGINKLGEKHEEVVLTVGSQALDALEEVASHIEYMKTELKDQKEIILQMQKKINEQQSTIDILMKE